MVAATLDIYNTIADNLLPTPAKSHYTFNLRDLSKVFQVRGAHILTVTRMSTYCHGYTKIVFSRFSADQCHALTRGQHLLPPPRWLAHAFLFLFRVGFSTPNSVGLRFVVLTHTVRTVCKRSH